MPIDLTFDIPNGKEEEAKKLNKELNEVPNIQSSINGDELSVTFNNVVTMNSEIIDNINKRLD